MPICLLAIENGNTYGICIHTPHHMRHLAILMILLLAAGTAASGCTSTTDYRYSGDPDPSGAAPSSSSEPETLEILTHEMQYEGGGWTYYATVVGTAKNVGTTRISHSSVKVKFYDPDGNLVGSGLDMVSDLDPGETWKFKVMCTALDEEVESYKIGVGSTW